MKRALSKGIPEIISSEQGGHFTNPDDIELIKSHEVRISMNDRGQALDNVRIERFFRTLKYDDIVINEYNTPQDLRKGIHACMVQYNTFRPQDFLGGDIPIIFHKLQVAAAAA